VTERNAPPVQCPDSAISLAGFQVSTYGRFWVSPEARNAGFSPAVWSPVMSAGGGRERSGLNIGQKHSGPASSRAAFSVPFFPGLCPGPGQGLSTPNDPMPISLSASPLVSRARHSPPPPAFYGGFA